MDGFARRVAHGAWQRFPPAARAAVLRAIRRAPAPLALAYDRDVLTRHFAAIYGRPPDLDAPRGFSERLLREQLTVRTPILTRIADKIAVRDYARERIGEEHIVPLHGVWRRSADIDWAALPDAFAVKVNHGWRWNILVRDRATADRAAIGRQLDAWLALNYYDISREWCYRDIPPRILAEELLVEPGLSVPPSMQIYTFGGRARVLQIVHELVTKSASESWHDIRTGERLQLRRPNRRAPDPRPVPPELDLDHVRHLAERLAQGFLFLRVDFYWTQGRLLLSELVLTPAAGFDRYDPPEWDLRFGEMWANGGAA
jgi:hypothetical protein